jgi:HEAT repeat protein
MFDNEPLSPQDKSSNPRWTRHNLRCCLVPLVLIAALALPERARCEDTESVAVYHLRQALRTSYPSLTERDRVLKQCLAELRSLAELQQAVTLVEWAATSDDEPTAAIDRANRATVLERFCTALRRLLRQGDAAKVAGALEMLDGMAASARAAGAPLTVVRGFATDLADLVLQGPPSVRGAAARTLAQIEPPVYVAVPVLTELLQATDVEMRRLAADGFALLIQNALRAASESGAVLRPAPRGELVLVASTVLPAVHAGLEDVRPEIRRRCLAAIGFACTALTRLLDNPLVSEEGASRSLEAEAEELRPLLLALRDQGPILTRCLHDSDAETRIWTHKALEELGVARGRWLARCVARADGTEENLLAELLHEAMPGLAEELTHPDVRVRRSAVDVLEMSGSLALPALPALQRALNDPDRFVRWSAVRTVGKLGPSAAPLTVADLTRMLRDPDVDLRNAAAHALARLNAPLTKKEESHHESHE